MVVAFAGCGTSLQMLHYSLSGEANFAIETDMNEQNGFPPNTEGKINSGGVSIGVPRTSVGFGGSVYGDASFTYMTASGNVVDAIDGVVKKFESALGEIGVTPQDIGIKDTKGFIQSMHQQAIDQSTKEEDED